LAPGVIKPALRESIRSRDAPLPLFYALPDRRPPGRGGAGHDIAPQRLAIEL